MTRNISIQKAFLTQSGEDIKSATGMAMNDLQSQLRQNSQVVGISGQRRPRGLKEGDLTARLSSQGGLALAVSDARGNVREIVLNLLNDQTGSGAPTVVQFPLSGQWGFYEDTAGPTLYLVRNRNGTIVKVALS